MIKRDITEELLLSASEFPVVSIYGPRQSGKTTLVRETFPEKRWISFEDPDVRASAIDDPRRFLSSIRNGAFIDEVQRFPEFLSYLQRVVDEDPTPGRFILSGSHQARLKRGIAQSLAGRTAVLTLLPLSLSEIRHGAGVVANAFSHIMTGGYPRLHKARIRPSRFFASYVETYLEKDLPDILTIRNRRLFLDFLFILASRTGQIVNYSQMASDLGMSSQTLNAWTSALEESNLVFRLQSWTRNATRQVVKSPKVYFTDTGLAAYLARLKTENEIAGGMLRGGLFENMVIIELKKYALNHAIDVDFRFFRDAYGNEVDLILDFGSRVKALEIKSAETLKTDFTKGIELFGRLFGVDKGYVVYGGNSPVNEVRGFCAVNPLDADFARSIME